MLPETPRCPALCQTEVRLAHQSEDEWECQRKSLQYGKKLTRWCPIELDSNSEPLTDFASLSTFPSLSESVLLPEG